MKKIVAISDLHGELIEVPECDLFIIAGDICPCRSHHTPFEQANWLRDFFNPWLSAIPAKHKIFIAGNHDGVFQECPNLLPRFPAMYLENNSIIVDGNIVWGSPWTPHFCNWFFNFRPGDRKQAKNCWDLIPDKTDILVTHGPPFGYGDLTTYGKRVSVGCPDLLEAVKRVKPKYHFFGHIHEGCESDTIMEMKHENGKRTLLCNVSVLNESYIRTKPCTIVEI